MGPLNYTVPITDPDGQTLTVMWSVVPTGFTPAFNMASNPDYSVDLDGLTSSGIIRCQRAGFDGFDTVQGTLLTVTHNIQRRWQVQ